MIFAIVFNFLIFVIFILLQIGGGHPPNPAPLPRQKSTPVHHDVQFKWGRTLMDMVQGSEAGTCYSCTFPCVTCPFLRKTFWRSWKSADLNSCVMKKGESFSIFYGAQCSYKLSSLQHIIPSCVLASVLSLQHPTLFIHTRGLVLASRARNMSRLAGFQCYAIKKNPNIQ